MVLGHNFDSVRAYEATLRRGHEDLAGPTWRGLLSFLPRAEISPERCFFTNFFMGLKDDASSVGEFPGARDREFVDRCRASGESWQAWSCSPPACPACFRYRGPGRSCLPCWES